VSVASLIRNAPKEFHLSVRLDPQPWRQVGQAVVDRDGLRGSGARHILLFVHGFNNSEGDAAKSYGRFFAVMRDGLRRSRVAPDAVAYFHWPGDLTGGATAYPYDVGQAKDSATTLARYLADIPSPGGDPRSLLVSLIGHSLGCRLVLEALAALAPSPRRPEIVFVGLMAAAVGVRAVDVGRPLRAMDTLPKRLTKFFSTRDWVLLGAFPAGQTAAAARGLDDAHREAVGRNGNPASFGSGQSTTNGHSDYWPDPVIAEGVVPAIDASVSMIRPTPAIIPGNVIGARDLPAPHSLGGRSLPS
jgi:hypothetical protein